MRTRPFMAASLLCALVFSSGCTWVSLPPIPVPATASPAETPTVTVVATPVDTPVSVAPVASPIATSTPAALPTPSVPAIPTLQQPSPTPSPPLSATRSPSRTIIKYTGNIEIAKAGASGLVNFAVSKDGGNIADQLWLLYDPEMPVGPRFVKGPALAWHIYEGQPLNTDGSFKVTDIIELEDEVWEMVTQGQISNEWASGTLRVFRHSPLAEPWSSGPLAWTAKRLPF